MTPTPLALSRAMSPNKIVRLAIGQRCGRLVQDEDTQVAAHRLGDLDELLLAARQLRDGPVEIDAAFERSE